VSAARALAEARKFLRFIVILTKGRVEVKVPCGAAMKKMRLADSRFEILDANRYTST
jgi:hypothetical protein